MKQIEETILYDLGKYKDNLISMILSSPDICESLVGHQCTDNEISDLVYKQVFPYLYVDDTQTDVLSYICVEANIIRVPTGTIKDIQLHIWCYSHKDCMPYYKDGYSGTRPDILCDMISKLLMDDEARRKFGIGKPTLTSVQYFYPQNKFYGRQMIYTIPDFKSKELKSWN